MIKHILLAFLSDIKLAKAKDGKVIVSKATYPDLHDQWGQTESTNESAIRYLLQRGWVQEHKHMVQPIGRIDKLFVFASKKVREEDMKTWDKQPYRDADGKTCTHLQFLKKNLASRGIIPVLDESHFYMYPFNEDDDNSLEAVTDMAEKIRAYVESEKENAKLNGTSVKCVLHVDLSGGMRHISMMMLELMRLMEYNRIQIGSVLYSYLYDIPKKLGKVEEVTDVYKMFDLISGAEEFVRFGSVSVMQDYFSHSLDDKSKALKNLLDAMNAFAEAIKLCHRGSFEQAIESLRQAIQEFNRHCENDVAINRNDKLMLPLLGRIEDGYKTLLQLHDQLDAIEWCLERDYIQQALTLYTETIPQYLFDKKIISFTQKGKEEIEILVEGDRRDVTFYALNNYDIFSSEQQDIDRLFRKMIDETNASQDELLLTVLELQKRQKKVKEDREVARKRIEKQGLVPNSDKIKNVYYKQLREAIRILVDKLQPVVKKAAKQTADNSNDNRQWELLLEQCKNDFFTTLEKKKEGIQPSEWFDEDKMELSFRMLIHLIKTPGNTIKTYEHTAWMQQALKGLYKNDKSLEKAKPWTQGKALLKYILNTAPKEELLSIISPVKDLFVLKLYRLFNDNRLELHVDIKKFSAVWNQYGNLKKERNKSNHARADEKYMTSSELKQTMQQGIDELRKLSIK